MADRRFRFDWLILPVLGTVLVLVLWLVSCRTWAPGLPSPLKTWEMSKVYVLQPFAKRGELDQGILRFTWNSLILVAKVFVGRPTRRAARLHFGHFQTVHAGL